MTTVPLTLSPVVKLRVTVSTPEDTNTDVPSGLAMPVCELVATGTAMVPELMVMLVPSIFTVPRVAVVEALNNAAVTKYSVARGVPPRVLPSMTTTVALLVSTNSSPSLPAKVLIKLVEPRRN